MLGAARWRNHYHAERVPDADARWLTTTAEGGWLRAQAVRDLAGRVLGCSRGAHGLILARLADGVDPDAIREELREFALETAPLLGGEA